MLSSRSREDRNVASGESFSISIGFDGSGSNSVGLLPALLRLLTPADPPCRLVSEELALHDFPCDTKPDSDEACTFGDRDCSVFRSGPVFTRGTGRKVLPAE